MFGAGRVGGIQTTEKELRLGSLLNFYVFVLLFLCYRNYNITNNPERTSFGKVFPLYCSSFLLLSETKLEQEPRFRGSNPPKLPHNVLIFLFVNEKQDIVTGVGCYGASRRKLLFIISHKSDDRSREIFGIHILNEFNLTCHFKRTPS